LLGVKIGAEIAGVIVVSCTGEGVGVRVFCVLEVACACGVPVSVEEADCAGILFSCVSPNRNKPENKSSRRPIRTSKEKITALEKGEYLLRCGCL
jgi:hypothetical protein